MFGRALAFLITFVALFALTFIFLAVVDALPEPIDAPTQEVEEEQEDPIVVEEPESPVRVVAHDIGLDVSVETPRSTDIDVLNEALMRTAVHYPTSAPLGINGTALLFGHSSYLPIVSNPLYRAFNNLGTLEVGDVVSVYSDTKEYRYSVKSVRLANAEEDVIELPSNGKYLVLVTCKSFGGDKTARWVVNADFVGAYAL